MITRIATAWMVLLSLLVLGGPLAAQSPGGGPGRIATARPILDPVIINGPPMPEEMIDVVELGASQYESYASQYRTFMQETGAARGSIMEMRRRMRERMGEAGGGAPEPRSREEMDAIRHQMDGTRKTMESLERSQKAFDQNLKTLLSETQFKRYQKWREEQRRASEGPEGGVMPPRLALPSAPSR